MIRKQSIFIGLFLATASLGVILYFGVKKQVPPVIESPYDFTTGAPGKKKILILTSRGGGGNLSVSNALTTYLQNDYTIGSVFVFTQILEKLDPFQKFYDSNYTGEDWHNYMAKRKWNRLMSFYLQFASWFYDVRKESCAELIEAYFIKHKPDLVISVIPIINDIVLSVAEKLTIPFLIVPTDFDATIAVTHINNPSYKDLYLALPFNDPTIAKTFESAHIPESQIVYTGFPIRTDFFKHHNKRKIKEEFNVPKNKPVVLLLMGSQGSDELYEFSRQLAKVTIPAHVIIALGRSEDLRKSISRIIFPKHLTRSILSFTPRIADLMAISDVFITKSGSVSLNEAIYMRLPMLLDATAPVLDWEKFNPEFITSHGLGFLIKRSYQIPTLVAKLINNPQERARMEKNFAALTKKNPEQEIKALVQKILKDKH